MNVRIYRGRPLPLGVTTIGNGTNFALLCKHGTSVRLILEPVDEEGINAEIELDPHKNRTGHNWHVRLEGLPDRFRYGWRVDGPAGPQHRFDSGIVLLDPAAT